jgi:S-adenosylmethionine-diacylglycerol 3-amino-3-carboxypropyl transferase
MNNNKLQFAVVREDPLVDINIMQHFDCKSPLLIASGGCTALSLLSSFPSIPVTVFDPNSAQLEHVHKKHESLDLLFDNDRLEFFGELNEAGNFESLFKMFRLFLYEHVISETDMKEVMLGNFKKRESMLTSPYWPVAFEMFFCDPYLKTMFGNAAIQNAPADSYPKYFRERLEQGLISNRCSENYFLHHIFLGRYISSRSLPPYLTAPTRKEGLTYVEGYLGDVSNLASFDYVMLSNIFDWMSEDEIDEAIGRLKYLCVGSVVVCRVLNNTKNIEEKLSQILNIDKGLSKKMFGLDRSLFYSSLIVGRRK